MDNADTGLESGIDPIYDQLRGKTATAVTEIPVTQNSAHPRLSHDIFDSDSLHDSPSHDIFDSDPLSHDQFSSPSINPANGLPMIDNAIDIEGNAFGTSSDMGIGLFDSHDPFDSHDSFSSFDSHDSFSSFDDPFS